MTAITTYMVIFDAHKKYPEDMKDIDKEVLDLYIKLNRRRSRRPRNTVKTMRFMKRRNLL